MGFFESARLPARKNLMHRIRQRIGLRLWPRVKEVATGQAVRSRDLVIKSGDEIILIGDGCDIRIESLDAGDIGRTGRGERPQGEIRLDRRYGGRARCGIRHVNGSGRFLALAKSFVRTKEEGSVLDNRPSGGPSKLDAAERSNRRSIEIVAGIENAV